MPKGISTFLSTLTGLEKGCFGHFSKIIFHHYYGSGGAFCQSERKKTARIFKKSLRLTVRRYLVFVLIVKGERQRFGLLLPLITRQRGQARLSTAAHFAPFISTVDGCDWLRYVHNIFTKKYPHLIELSMKMCNTKYADSKSYLTIDMIGGNIMYRFIGKQFGLWRVRFWCSPQLWRGQIKIIHMGAQARLLIVGLCAFLFKSIHTSLRFNEKGGFS